jgi:apolipoprotein N-acyltransferase
MSTPIIVYWWIFPLFIWSLIWKGIALWKCGRRNQPAWFIVLLVFNTAGILPIIYILFFQKKKKKSKKRKKNKKKKTSKKKK